MNTAFSPVTRPAYPVTRTHPAVEARRAKATDRGALSDAQREALLGELGIRDAGQTFRFRGYRYDRLEDAVAYARRVKARAWQKLDEDRDRHGRVVDDEPPPQTADRPAMAALGVGYRDGRYRFGPYAYTRMADALAYARRLQLP